MIQSLYLRLSVTDRCNLRCVYCRPSGACVASRANDDRALAREEMVDLVRAIHRVVPIRKLRLTGGEPLLRADITAIVRDVRKALPRATLAMTTNGTRLVGRASELRAAGLDAINVSLDAIDEPSFSVITGGGRVDAVLEGLRAARDERFDALKMNAVLLESLNGARLADIVRLAADHGAEPRFIELMPSGSGAALHASEFLPAGEALRRLSDELHYEGPIGQAGTALRHRFRDGDRLIVVGFITPVSSPFCTGCDRLRLDARGRLFGCLRRTDHGDLAGPLRDGDAQSLQERIECALREKAPPGDGWLSRPMVAIGG